MRAKKLLSLAQKNSLFLPTKIKALPLQYKKNKNSTANKQNVQDFRIF